MEQEETKNAIAQACQGQRIYPNAVAFKNVIQEVAPRERQKKNNERNVEIVQNPESGDPLVDIAVADGRKLLYDDRY